MISSSSLLKHIVIIHSPERSLSNKSEYTCLYPVASSSWDLLAPLFRFRTLWIRNRVTGRFRTSSLHTSQVLLPFILNHLIAHSWWARASSPLQLHSNLKVSPPSHRSTRQILHTASSSAISSPLASWFSAPWTYWWITNFVQDMKM